MDFCPFCLHLFFTQIALIQFFTPFIFLGLYSSILSDTQRNTNARDDLRVLNADEYATAVRSHVVQQSIKFARFHSLLGYMNTIGIVVYRCSFRRPG